MTGFFGKLPSSGDFVARGLAPGVKSVLDRWVSQYLAAHAREPDKWPELGVRAALGVPDGAIALVAVPSHDAAARRFPLVGVADLGMADQMSVDIWADKVLPLVWDAIDTGQDADALAAQLATVTSPETALSPLNAPLVWADEVDPSDPDTSLDRLFS